MKVVAKNSHITSRYSLNAGSTTEVNLDSSVNRPNNMFLLKNDVSS